MRPTMYLRGGLMRGLEQEAKLGVNPFKFGMIGSTDVHTSLTAIEEDNFFGKEITQEPNPHRWEHVIEGRASERRATAGSYARRRLRRRLGHREHARSDVGRDEAQGGVRHLRLAHDRALLRRLGLQSGRCAQPRSSPDAGYAKGVPMGGDLAKAPAGKAPTFLVAAAKDPMSGNLDRIQIVKGWLGKDGKAQERIYDVAWGDAERRKRGKNGKLPRGRQHGGRGDRHLDEHDRRSGTVGRLDGPGLRSRRCAPSTTRA